MKTSFPVSATGLSVYFNALQLVSGKLGTSSLGVQRLNPLPNSAVGMYTFASVVISRTIITTISGLSTTILSNPAWTGNTAVTSAIVESGRTVIATLPVLYGCSLCGGDGHGLVIYELSGLPTFTIRASRQPVPKLASTLFASLSSSYTADTNLPSISSVSSQPMVISTLPSTAAATHLTRLSIMTPSFEFDIISKLASIFQNAFSLGVRTRYIVNLFRTILKIIPRFKQPHPLQDHLGVLLALSIQNDKVPGRSQRNETRLLPQHPSVPTIT